MSQIIGAVGIGRRPGAYTIKADLVRMLRRIFIHTLLRTGLPEAAQDAMLRASQRMMGRWPAFSGASIGNTMENDILKLVFNATAIADIADNDATSPLTNIFVALHTGDPGEGGTQNTSEISYTGYARISVARTTGGWTAASAGSTSPVANIDFGEMTAGAGGTVTHFSTGTLTSGAGILLWTGTVTPNISVVNGVIPRLKTTSTITLD
jgi:hypothetical protein